VTPNLKSEQYGVAVNAVPLPVPGGGLSCIFRAFVQYQPSAGVISEVDNDRFRSLWFACFVSHYVRRSVVFDAIMVLK